MTAQTYDTIIIGGGPAGLTAGIYASRARRRTLLVEKEMIGGNIVYAEKVENYPGFAEGISGMDLTQAMHNQATKFGMETLSAEIQGINVQGENRSIKTSEGEFAARTLIIAGGSTRQLLGAPGEKEFTGRGVSYCATCDAAFFVDQPVAVIGGGNAAIQEAVHLTRFASEVTLIHRRGELRATKIEQERASAEPKIKYAWNSTVVSINGNDTVDALGIKNVQTNQESTLKVKGVFVAIGFIPNTAYLRGVVPLDEAGQILVNGKMETNLAGVYAAGDIRSGSLRQVVMACSDGATAAMTADEFMAKHK